MASPEISCVQDMLTEKNVIMNGPVYTTTAPSGGIYVYQLLVIFNCDE
jgi:hypothetical protein